MERATADRSAVVVELRARTSVPERDWPSRAMRSPDDPRATATLAAVERLLEHQTSQLKELWSRLSGGQPVDVLADDLPAWLDGWLRRRGKRLRPALCHWGYLAAGGHMGHPEHTDMVRAAAALELLHHFALLHDDVMDESDWRRGGLAAHRQAEGWHADAGARGDSAHFGRNLAVLLGDLALVSAHRLAATLPPRLRELWHELCVELILGQCGDLTGAAAGRRDRSYVERLAQLKSGSYTVLRPLALGATAAGASAAAHRALHSYGVHAGAAFALRDEVLGVWGDPAVTGKPASDDLRTGKPTVLLSLAADRLEGAAAELVRMAGGSSMTAAEVATLKMAMSAAGVKDEMEALILSHVEDALAAVTDEALHPAGVAGLVDLTLALAWRTS